MKKIIICFLGVLTFVQLGLRTAQAWDYEGHRAVNQIALASLPANFPAFVKTPVAAERIAFLAGEPDRWRNPQEHTLNHVNQPDHFIDMEYLANFDMKPETVSPFRYDFVSQIAAARVKNPGIEPKANPERDVNHNYTFFGFLPWTINEYYAKLKLEFSYLKAFEEHGGTPDEIRNAQENIIYTMGVMGHFVGDGSQPLHTTTHFNGWGNFPNPKGFTSDRKFHQLIDGGYFTKVGIGLPDLLTNVQPAHVIEGANTGDAGMFQQVMKYIGSANELVEPLYQLEKDGKLTGEGAVGMEGLKFLQKQLLVGGQELGDIWLTAWQTAPEDAYLKGELERRKAAAEKKTAAVDTAPLAISIAADGGLHLGQDNKAVTVDELKSELLSATAKNPELQIAIKADKAAPMGQIAKVMDAAKEAKVKTVSALTAEAKP